MWYAGSYMESNMAAFRQAVRWHHSEIVLYHVRAFRHRTRNTNVVIQ